MTRKSTLSAWAIRLGVNPGEGATAAQLEQAITQGIDRSMTLPKPQPEYTFRQVLVNNGRVLVDELPATVKAIANNLRS